MRPLLAALVVTALARPALAARGFTVGAPYAGLQDTLYTEAEDRRAIEGLRAAPGVNVVVTDLVLVGGLPVRRIEVTPRPIAGTTPVHIGISAGVHRDEPEGLRVADQLMHDAAAGRVGNVRYTFYRPVNASPQAGRERLTDQGTDLNRSFTFSNKTRPRELRPLREDLRAQDFDRFYDLHGGKQEGFFVIGRDADDPEIARAMRALPSWLVVSRYGKRATPLSTPGMKTSTNRGTLRRFVERQGVPAYTVEYPRRADPRWQRQGLRRLVDSLVSHAVLARRSPAARTPARR